MIRVIAKHLKEPLRAWRRVHRLRKASPGSTIGGAHCLVIPANHGTGRLDTPIYLQPLAMIGISIGNDIWIGAHAAILDGVTVENGSVIAAGSVVSRNGPTNSVSGGFPAQTIKVRAHEP